MTPVCTYKQINSCFILNKLYMYKKNACVYKTVNMLPENKLPNFFLSPIPYKSMSLLNKIRNLLDIIINLLITIFEVQGK